MADGGHNGSAPQLGGAALDAIRYRGGHLQIIAGAGSGKTEVVAQRVVDLLADGVPAEAIVAFTFTERAAEELKNRIAHRVEGRMGRQALDRLTSLFVGTIHAYCFRLLQQRVPRFETYDVLDDNRLTAFLSREAKRLELRQLDPNNRLFEPRREASTNSPVGLTPNARRSSSRVVRLPGAMLQLGLDGRSARVETRAGPAS